MDNVNYFSGIVKILENPRQIFYVNKFIGSSVHAEIPQIRKNKIILLIFLGNLSNEMINYYNTNDYILVEGYLSKKNKQTRLNRTTNNQISLFILKVYPFFLESKQLNHKNKIE